MGLHLAFPLVVLDTSNLVEETDPAPKARDCARWLTTVHRRPSTADSAQERLGTSPPADYKKTW
jgi:hypothetical protein